jgi:AraC family transcriptional regulator, exoenzyme S synthesis regulatory protein ExsA
MKAVAIRSCYIGPEISPEQYISEHFFLFLIKGSIEGYDVNRHYTLLPGESCIVRKNRLVRYSKHRDNDRFEKVVIIFDKPFLQTFFGKNHKRLTGFNSNDTFLPVNRNKFLEPFLQSLHPYYKDGKINKTFANLKREELLLILLEAHPGYADIFFNFGEPEKIDLESFMNNNYKFNVSINRFAYLTGRSVSGFKRDFEKIFNDTPHHWLMQKRLKEAHFLIEKKQQKASEIYLDLGFEDLSHFSYSFKKLFGTAPALLSGKSRSTI